MDYRFDQEERPSGWNLWLVLGPVMLLVGAGMLTYILTTGNRSKNGRPETADGRPRAVAPRGERDPEETARIQLFKDVKDCVVNVDTILFQRDSFNLNEAERKQGTGSGFIWDDKGHIVTNYHVILAALQQNRNLAVRVILSDRSGYNATLVGASPDHDLAVLKIEADASKLKPIRIGKSSEVEVGQTAYAVGNPFGLSLTLTMGIVSALDREIESVSDRPITGVIQTDAAINPGNSGGPLFDRDGRLIGVNTAITSPTGGNVGIGYSIPVDTVSEVVPELILSGRTLRPVLGMIFLPDRYKRSLNVNKGLIIQEVRPKGPADTSGLRGLTRTARGDRQVGDILLAIKGEPVNSFTDYDRAMSRCKVGEKIVVTIQRGREVLEVELVVSGV